MVLLLITITAIMNGVLHHGLILASKSPRRRDLLAQAGLVFTVIPSTVHEDRAATTSPKTHVRQLAEAKAREVAQRYPESWIIGADTEVVINGTVLGKPGNPDEARQMLERLSGRTHRVLTGYCILSARQNRSFSETVETHVQFKSLSEAEIHWYVNTQEPYDKSGGYAVQGMGAVLVKRIEGSYTNVVGLPVCEVVECLMKAGAVKR
jgi:septum formation protein